MANKIKCTCGHSWNKSDSSKKDASVCHVCGKDTTMQLGGYVYPVNYVPQKENGGWLDAYEDDVPEAQMGTMVTPLDFSKPIGTLEGVSDVMSAPARTATYLLTGKYQDPSQALGIKNPWGALATDMILDPVNLIGAGVVGKAAKAAVKASKETGVLSKAHKLNPWAFKPNPEAGYRMIGGKEGYLDAITSGQIRPTGAYEHAHFNIGQPLNPNRLSAEELIQAGSPGGYKGPYMAEMQQGTWQRMSDAFSNNPEMQEQFRLLGKDKDVWQHPLFGNIKADDPRLKLYKENWLKGYKEVPKSKKKQDGGWLDKFDVPEAQNGIEGTMGGLTDKGFNYNGAWGGPSMQFGGNLPGAVGSMYARVGAPSKGPRRNQTSVTDASAQNGAEMKFYQAGLDWKPRNISRDGSVTKDDNGYWNPENWGKPVEIGSNNITMQGVYEPLLGISDTGDTQLMMPGEDYTFDGESVTEYPVAQNGKKVKIPMSDFKKMGSNYVDSLNTYDYTQALWEALNKGNSSEVDQTILRNKNLINNTSNVKPTSYDNVTVGGKNYRIPSYEYPKMDPWENYEPVKGFWDNVDSKLSSISNTIGKTAIGKSMQKIDNKIDEGVKKVWRKFVDNDKEDNVQNQGATLSSSVKKQSGPPKQSPPQSTKPKLENDSYIKKYSPIYLDNPKDPRIGQYTEKGNQYLYKKPKQSVEYKKPKSKQEVVKKQEPTQPPVKKTEQPKPIERKQNVYEGSPVYSPGAGIGMGSALVGFLGQKGDTTYIKPEDYERFAVPKYGKEFIESKTKKKKNGGWLEKYK